MKTTVDQLMVSSNVKFGTSGVRGLVDDMNDFVCFAYASGFLQYAKQLVDQNGQKFNRVAVACDLRTSSPRIVKAVLWAVKNFGLKPVDCGKIPTPALALYGIVEKIPSIMITGSHIPEDRNGIKFHLPEGEILKKDEMPIREQTVEISDELFDENKMLRQTTLPESTKNEEETAKRYYIDRFVKALPKKCLSGFRIGLYEHSSVARDLLYDLYTTLGATVIRLGRSEKFVAVDTEAVRDEDLELARNWAHGKNLPAGTVVNPDSPPFDAIVSTDGDGDRPLLFDEFGNWIRGDIAGVLAARFLLADCVVTPITSSSVLERSCWFKKIIRTKIGSPYVVAEMLNAASQGFERVVGYEANGGFLTATPILVDEEHSKTPLIALPTRDSAIVHIGALCYARRHGIHLSDLEKDLPHRIVMSDRLKNFPTDLARQKIEELSVGGMETMRLVFASYGDLVSADKTDGIRMTFGNGDIVHIRASGNAPELRCYTEADTQDRAASLLYRTLTILDSWRRRSQNDEYPYKQ